MNRYQDVRDFYTSKMGEPVREALFVKDEFKIGILKWSASVATGGVTLYGTLGSSDYPLPGRHWGHRQEFFIGFAPEWDDIAEPLAQLGSYTQFRSANLESGHTLRLPVELVEETWLRGFLVVEPLDDVLSRVALGDGRHVEFLMAIPLYSNELDFAAKRGAEALRDAMSEKNIPFWKARRRSTFIDG
ncbi:suppressor of fused domain protein [Nonomuraea sp. MG754425]|uniref:suppressor of fused domain protein n=1 Tax=Nonomuraea sp. MG754425 TaxID=2570319 RepID=UPI001F29E0A5|nr:suppressor of fused domain protein [Nonomuraea sp. MG754425]MCF6468423.1 suppressor of fused domain protein [Nonomuraea sp. MG754425]